MHWTDYKFIYRLIINENLDKGTQIPYIKRAMQEDYEVMVLNTNLNDAEDSSDRIHGASIRVSYLSNVSAVCVDSLQKDNLLNLPAENKISAFENIPRLYWGEEP